MSAHAQPRLYDPAPIGEQTIGQVIGLYLAHLAARVEAGEYTARARANVARILGDFEIEAGRLPLPAAKQIHLSAWLTAQAGRWSRRSRNDAGATVVQCFRWAADEQVIDRCPFRKPKIGGSSPSRKAFLYDELRAMRLALEKRAARRKEEVRSFRHALYFLWHTGARSGEMRGLKWSDIDWDCGVARLAEHKTRHHTGEDRIIPLNESILRLLRAKKARATSPYVFTCVYGRPWLDRGKSSSMAEGKDAFCCLFRRWVKRAGDCHPLGQSGMWGISAHSIRHGYCVRCIEAGLSDRATADQGGWRKTTMVSHYGAQARSRVAHLKGDAEAVRRSRR